ncbi:hypothetical protein [Gordonia sp. (in: high G+C Gram-positive bacteria)]|uniref:hypothetical protein n=1 Tax=Gordonia sp. (in: high G+C Gram-positive bacteria) TaxID=84139 RepID=UPI003F996519
MPINIRARNAVRVVREAALRVLLEDDPDRRTLLEEGANSGPRIDDTSCSQRDR